jgi:hypothetical protein
VADAIDTMTPDAASAVADRPDYYDEGCEVDVTVAGTVACEFGEQTSPSLTVALVGDSKIGQWLPAIDMLAEEHGWRIVTYMRSRCPWTTTQTTVGAGDVSAYSECSAWGRDVLDRLSANPPDVLLTSDRPSVGTPEHTKADAVSRAAIGEGMTTYWQQMTDLGVHVVALRETPEMGVNVPDCISTPGATLVDCDRARAKAVKDDAPTVVATRAMEGAVPLVDLTDLICSPETCSPVVGGVLVYRDKHHLTKTYVMSLAPYLARDLLSTGAFSPRGA